MAHLFELNEPWLVGLLPIRVQVHLGERWQKGVEVWSVVSEKDSIRVSATYRERVIATRGEVFFGCGFWILTLSVAGCLRHKLLCRGLVHTRRDQWDVPLLGVARIETGFRP